MIEFYLWSVLVLFIIMFIVEARSEDEPHDMDFQVIILVPFLWPALAVLAIAGAAFFGLFYLLWKAARVGL